MANLVRALAGPAAVFSLFIFVIGPIRSDEPDKETKKPKPKFTIGKHTTYITGPLDKNGYINYQAALNTRFGKGVTLENNACALLWKAVGPHPERPGVTKYYFELLGMPAPPVNGNYFSGFWDYTEKRFKIDDQRERDALDKQLKRATKRPWKAQDYPLLSVWLDESEKPLSIAIGATKNPRYFSPWDDHFVMIEGGSHQASDCRALAQALAARALLRVNANRLDDAWRDLFACHRLGRLLAQNGASNDWLYGTAIDLIASEADLAWVSAEGQDAKRIKNALRDLATLPPFPKLADSVDVADRFAFLDHIQSVSRRGIPYLEELTAVGKPQPPTELQKHLLDDADWDPALRNANRWFDRIVAALRQKDYQERVRQLEQFEEHFRAVRKRLLGGDLIKLIGDAKDKGEVVGDMSICLVLRPYIRFQEIADRAAQTKRNLDLAFALAGYRHENGKYPATLGDLAPKYLAKVPDDLFTGNPLVYQPSENGYLLNSLGPDGKDDAGRGPEDDPKGDDLSVRMPLPKLKD